MATPQEDLQFTLEWALTRIDYRRILSEHELAWAYSRLQLPHDTSLGKFASFMTEHSDSDAVQGVLHRLSSEDFIYDVGDCELVKMTIADLSQYDKDQLVLPTEDDE